MAEYEHRPPSSSLTGVAVDIARFQRGSTYKSWIAVLASGSGNLLEFFDFALYAYFVSTISELFFPNADPVVSLLETFAAYGVGFMARPLGSLLIGRIGATRGRKPAMLLTVGCMAIGSIGIGLVPTYETIGTAAPVLLVASRILQGFAAGGEYGTSVSYIIEWAPPNRRGFFGSFQSVTSSASTLLASLVATLVLFYANDANHTWLWRIPFIGGGIAISLFSLFVRSKAEETPEYKQSKIDGSVSFDVSRLLLCAKAFGFTIFWTVLSYLCSSYMFTFTQRQAGLTRGEALFSNDTAYLVQVALIPVAGALSDRIGRKPLLLFSCASTAVLAYPIMSGMSNGASFGTVLLLQSLLAALFAMFSGPGPATICAMFPTQFRTTWMSLGYTLAVSIFGGFSPFASTWLISVSGQAASPAFLLIPAALITSCVVWMLPSERSGTLYRPSRSVPK